MAQTNSQTAPPAVPRPFQFSLRALFLVVTLASLVSAGVAVVERIKQRWEASLLEEEGVVDLRKLGGIVDNLGDGALVQLGGTKVTDADLVILRKVCSARYISLYDTAVTDAGLVHLRNLKNLRQLDLTHTQVTPDGVARLKESLPGVAIYREPQ